MTSDATHTPARRTKVRHIAYTADEFLVGVTGMHPFDIGVYWVVCSLIYSSGGPIPEDDERLFRILRAKPAHIRNSISRLVEKGKLRADRSGSELVRNLDSTRTERELNRASTRMEQRLKNLKYNGLDDRSRTIGPLTKNRTEKEETSLRSVSSSPSKATEATASFALEPPTNAVTKVPTKANGQSRAGRLPNPWPLTAQLVAIADEVRFHASLPPIGVETEHAKFCDYWHAKSGKDATKVDWIATWRNWIRNARGGMTRGGEAFGAGMRNSISDAMSLINPDPTPEEPDPWPALPEK